MKHYLDRIYILAKFFVRNLLFFTIKLDVLLVYIFSRTALFAFYVFSIVGGFCAGDKADLFSSFLFLFACYVSGTCFLLFIVCNTKSTMAWVERLVGVPFMEKFAPKKGKTNFLILVLTLLTLLIVDVVSMQFLITVKFVECSNLDEAIKNLTLLGKADQDNIENLYQIKYDILKNISNTKGIVSKSHDMFTLSNIHTFFKKL